MAKWTTWALACALLPAASACQRGAGDEASGTAPDVEPQLVFSDDFERAELGDDWRTTVDAWRIESGAVHVSGARNEGLWLTRPLPDAVRIEFDATATSEEGDIKFEVFTDGETHQSGYVGIFGGWDNRLNIIARLDEHGDDRLVGAEGKHVEVGRTYRFRIERTDQRVQWFVDGEPFITYDDAAPLTGAAHAYFGFNDWESPVVFDNISVWNLAP